MVKVPDFLPDAALEDLAAQEDTKPPATSPRVRGQALPASLPRIEHRHALKETRCTCGQALKRICQKVREQLEQALNPQLPRREKTLPL